MENRAKKIEKLNNLIAKLEGQDTLLTIRKKSVKEAKLKLRTLDPGYDISDTLKSLNSGNKEELIASLISQNFIKPFLIKLLRRL